MPQYTSPVSGCTCTRKACRFPGLPSPFDLLTHVFPLSTDLKQPPSNNVAYIVSLFRLDLGSMQSDVQGNTGNPVPDTFQVSPPSSETHTPPACPGEFASTCSQCGMSWRLLVAA